MDNIQEKVVNESCDDELNDLYSLLISNIPKETKVSLNNTEDGSNSNKVSEYNNDVMSTYLMGEVQHLEQQKSVAVIISIVVGIQLLLFNILIYLVVLKNIDINTRTLIFDFMKYYTGAVIVEMIGLCVVIVRGIYSLSIGNLAEHIIKRKNK